MKKVFAILQEPASYTTDRNRLVYDELGIDYCYIHDSSLAKSSELNNVKSIGNLPFKDLISRIKRILRENDLIIMNGYNGWIFLILYLLNLIYRKPIGIDSDTQLNIPSKLLKRCIKRLYLSSIFHNKLIYGLPGGTKTHKDLFRHYGMAEERICLMPMVVNNSRFCYPYLRENRVFRFLFVGRIIPVKGIDILLEAFSNAFKNHHNVELHIVGDGELFDEFKQNYTVDNIKFTGAKFEDELRQEYIDASAFILPSNYEPWGLVVNEAMAAGLPVIVSDQVGAAWDLVDGHETGFIFKYDDPEDLKNKMLTLYNNPELYKRFSSNAYHRLNDEWNYDYYRQCLIDFITKASCTK